LTNTSSIVSASYAVRVDSDVDLMISSPSSDALVHIDVSPFSCSFLTTEQIFIDNPTCQRDAVLSVGIFVVVLGVLMVAMILQAMFNTGLCVKVC